MNDELRAVKGIRTFFAWLGEGDIVDWCGQCGCELTRGDYHRCTIFDADADAEDEDNGRG